MNKIASIILSLCLLLCLSARAQADAAKPSEPVVVSNDKTNYRSDRVKYTFPISVSRVDTSQKSLPQVDACAPAFTTLQGVGSLLIGNETKQAFVVTSKDTPAGGKKVEAGQIVMGCTGPTTLVSKDDVVVIPDALLVSSPPDRYGLTYGTLMVPFKYHFRGDKDFSGGTSVGGYLGFRQDKSGVTGLAVQYVAFLGAATIEVPQTVDGATTTQNMTGVSYGLGLLGTVKDSFHMGLILGADRVNANAGYKDNGKAWLAVSLGFAFSN